MAIPAPTIVAIGELCRHSSALISPYAATLNILAKVGFGYYLALSRDSIKIRTSMYKANMLDIREMREAADDLFAHGTKRA